MVKRERTCLPKARTQELVIQALDDEVLIYDLRRHKAHCLNRTAHLVFETCDGRKTVSEINQVLTKELGVSVPEEVVCLALNQLGRAHLLEQFPGSSSGKQLTRREVLRKIGVATAVALPIVTSMIAPASAQAASCLPDLALCSMNSDCCSGMCGLLLLNLICLPI